MRGPRETLTPGPPRMEDHTMSGSDTVPVLITGGAVQRYIDACDVFSRTASDVLGTR